MYEGCNDAATGQIPVDILHACGWRHESGRERKLQDASADRFVFKAVFYGSENS